MDNRYSMRFGTWNIQTMLQAGKMMEVGDVLCNYNLDLIALQEIRWSGSGLIDKQNFTLYYSGAAKQGLYGTGFMVSRRLKRRILGFEPINDRLCSIRVKGHLYNSTFICCYAPINDATDDYKEQFYEDLQNACPRVPQYDALIVLGHMNAQVGKEQAFGEVAGKHSLHEVSNDNGQRLCFFAAANNLFISSTKFPHKAIHKGTWKIPGTDNVNQIDHILSCKRRMSNILDVRSYRGANCDSDHFLVVAKTVCRTSTIQCKGERRVRWDTEKLKDGEINIKYKQELTKQLEHLPPQSDIELDWNNIKQGMLEAAKETLGEVQRPRPEEWYDEECRVALEQKNAARLMYLQSKSTSHKEKYKEERDKTRRLIKRKKKNSDIKQIQALDEYGKRGNARPFFKKVNILRKGYQPRTNICRDHEGNAITDKTEILGRWREYFDSLLNVNSEASSSITYYDVEQEIHPPTLLDVELCIKRLQNNKATGLDTIATEMVKNAGPELIRRLHGLVTQIWLSETLPKDWCLGIVIPIHKKGDKTVCSNYRGISVLSTAYKIFSGLVYCELRRYAEEILGEYQCGFRPNRSTTDQIHLMRQTLEKSYEYDIELHHMFIDFKQAFDSVNRQKILDAMKILGIPSKLVRLVEATMCNSKSVVAIQNEISDPFEVRSGVRQGDALSTIVFNLTLEAAIRNLGVKGLIDYNTSQLAAYADDIVITSRSQSSMIRHTTTLQTEAAKYGLMVNASKTKYLASTRKPRPQQAVTIGDDTLEGVSSFKYLGSILSCQNRVEDEVNARIMAGNRCFYSLSKLFRSKHLSAKSKLSIYKTIVRPVTTYGCETWSLTVLETQKLAMFERKVLRKVFGPVRDASGEYRIRMNHELDALMNQETIVRFIKSQRLRWAGHVERMDKERAPKIMTDWKPQQKRPRGRPRKRWCDCIEDDLKALKRYTNWRRLARDRRTWQSIVEEAKTHKGL